MIEYLQALIPPQFYGATLAVAAILLMIGLLSVMPPLMAWLLRRWAPTWVTRATQSLQVAILVSGVGFMMGLLKITTFMTLLGVLVLLVIAAALRPNNVISDGLATLRIRAFGYYRPDDWVTLGKGVHGCVVAIHPFSTRLKTSTQEYQVVSNSAVVTNPIRIHPAALPVTAVALATPAPVVYMATAAEAKPVAPPSPLPIYSALDPGGAEHMASEPVVSVASEPVVSAVAPTTAAPVQEDVPPTAYAGQQQRLVTPLLPRAKLGKRSIAQLIS